MALAQSPVAVADSGSPLFTINTPNVHLLSHLPLGRSMTISGIAMDQDPNRPYVYVSRMLDASTPAGFTLISVKDPSHARVLYNYHISDPELHKGFGGMEGKTFRYGGRYYYIQGFQFSQGSPDADLGAIVFDVTGLPMSSTIKEVGRILAPTSAVSSGTRAPTVAVVQRGARCRVAFTTYSRTATLTAGRSSSRRRSRVPTPPSSTWASFSRRHPDQGFRPGSSPESHRAVPRFRRAVRPGLPSGQVLRRGAAGRVLRVRRDQAGNTQAPDVHHGRARARVSSFGRGHTITPTPDGRYVVTETEYQYAPLRIFDLKPGLDGKVQTISRPIGAWTANWKDLPHNHEVRWPYVFVSAYEDGMQVFNMLDPTNPRTVGYYRTYDGPHDAGETQAGRPDTTEVSLRAGSGVPLNGAWGIAVRNSDGLIVISDITTGFWALHMEGFDGWNGHDWGMPNVSTAQDWDHGPEGAPPTSKPAPPSTLREAGT